MHQVRYTRGAGILLPVSSLPSRYGIGTFGKEAYRWIDFLHQSGQRYWQILPLGPTGYGDSPYQSVCAFAGNPYFIDLERLIHEKLLRKKECNRLDWGNNCESVNYELLYHNRIQVLKIAYRRFQKWNELEEFRKQQMDWIEDYAFYMSIKEEMGGTPWLVWEDEVKFRHPDKLSRLKREYQDQIQYHIFVQYLFFTQWEQLKHYAHKKGIQIIGDIPIYASLDSSDVWSHPELFALDQNRNPIEVAGCPPDAFSQTGQLWGNPLYRWDKMKEDDYQWWIRRIQGAFGWYDIMRLDHFRGLESYYAIPYGREDAVIGEWKQGPGKDFINAIRKQIPHAKIIAEDLGLLTPEVKQLLSYSGYPGMKVLQFAFDGSPNNDYLPYQYNNHCVVYTGTHDNDTTKSWLQSQTGKTAHQLKEYLQRKEIQKETVGMICMAQSSVADLCIIPMQDYLELGTEARMNTPSTMGGRNWCWRLKKKDINKKNIKKIHKTTKIYGRMIQDKEETVY